MHLRLTLDLFLPHHQHGFLSGLSWAIPWRAYPPCWGMVGRRRPAPLVLPSSSRAASYTCFHDISKRSSSGSRLVALVFALVMGRLGRVGVGLISAESCLRLLGRRDNWCIVATIHTSYTFFSLLPLSIYTHTYTSTCTDKQLHFPKVNASHLTPNLEQRTYVTGYTDAL